MADFNELSADVTTEIEAVQFTITEVGSDLVPTQTAFTVTHNGQVETILSEVGILLTVEYALSRGFDVAKLRAQGLIADDPGHGNPPDDRPGNAPDAPPNN